MNEERLIATDLFFRFRYSFSYCSTKQRIKTFRYPRCEKRRKKERVVTSPSFRNWRRDQGENVRAVAMLELHVR
jgi:hypothetical protein